MKFAEFKKKVKKIPLIVGREAVKLSSDPQTMRNQLYRWGRKGLLIQLKRGVYILGKNERETEPNRLFIANQLLVPSYISMEYALNYYGLIPERVADITSVTTKKTTKFTNATGTYQYQHIKPNAWRGFKILKAEAGLKIMIAEPEKAIVDFLYLNLSKIKPMQTDIFRNSYRMQNTEILSAKKIMAWTKLYASKRLEAVAKLYCRFIEEER